MYYSLTFGDTNPKNTWADWRMIPDTPPMVPNPEPVINRVDIPGRLGGPLDLSTVPFGRLQYQRMTGSWIFYREPDNKYTRSVLYDELRKTLHAKEMKVVLEEDPEHYYFGRFTVGVPSTGRGPIKFTIAYDLQPTRYNRDGSVDTSYTGLQG